MVNFKTLDDLYFIAEIGINHNGDIDITKKLIDASFATSWDCVKFQKRNPDVCVPDHQKDVIRDTPWGRITYLEYKHKVEFGKEEYDYINDYCKEKPIDWTVSVWDVYRNDFKWSLLHCNSTYPAPEEDLNLNNIKMMQDKYNVPIGYSGHEQDLEACMVAVTLGANIIERHITLDHNMWGTDQKSSLEVVAMDMLKKRCNNIQTMLGKYERTVSSSEKEIRNKLRG